MKFDASGQTCMGGPIDPTIRSISPTITVPTPTVYNHTCPVISYAPIIATPTTSQTWPCNPLYNHEDEDEPPPEQGPYLRVEGNSLCLVLPRAADVQLSIYDPSGRLVARPVDGMVEAGEHEIELGDHTGSPLQKGVYLAVLRHPEGLKTVKIVR